MTRVPSAAQIEQRRNAAQAPRFGKHRPVPDDFAEHMGEPLTDLRKRYATGGGTILRWLAKCGTPRPENKRGPRMNTQTHERIRQAIADGLTTKQAAELIGYSVCAITRAARKHGLGTWAKTIIPGEVTYRERVASEKRERALARKVGRIVAPAKAQTPKSGRIWAANRGHERIVTQRYDRDTSPDGEAADYLRRFGPVYRCNSVGRPDIAGKFWRRGSAVLTSAELIERADYLRSREAVAA
jgi:hypothetical protein